MRGVEEGREGGRRKKRRNSLNGMKELDRRERERVSVIEAEPLEEDVSLVKEGREGTTEHTRT